MDDHKSRLIGEILEILADDQKGSIPYLVRADAGELFA
jgi:hypothetical protein